MIKKIVLWVIVIVVVGLVAAYFGRNWLVKKAIEEGGEYALGVKTTVSSVNLGIGGGRLEIHDFDVHNPEGFQGKNILSIKSADLAVETGSIFGNEVKVDSLVLDGLKVDLEQIDNKGNFTEILDHIKKLDLTSSSDNQQRFIIKRLAIRNVSAEASLVLLGKKQFAGSYELADVTLTDVGGDKGATVARLTAVVLQSVLTRSIGAAKRKLPGGFGTAIENEAKDNLQKLESDAKDKIKDLGKGLIGGGN